LSFCVAALPHVNAIRRHEAKRGRITIEDAKCYARAELEELKGKAAKWDRQQVQLAEVTKVVDDVFSDDG
jgi:hypothetical protein